MKYFIPPSLSIPHHNIICRFHERHGSLIKLFNNNRTAERKRPFDEFNNGVVMTHRPLRDNELFEIRLDRLVDKWSGSIEVRHSIGSSGSLHVSSGGSDHPQPRPAGVPCHHDQSQAGHHHDEVRTTIRECLNTFNFSGCGILTNGKGTRREYGQFNLDELAEGDRIGMIRWIFPQSSKML